MTHQPKLVELAERCEAATGPDRKLDMAIVHALSGVLGEPWPEATGMRMVEACDSFEDSRDTVARYTASLDAAMTLVPEGWIWDVTSTGTAWVMEDGGDPQLFGDAATPALALCAAALRAKEERNA